MDKERNIILFDGVCNLCNSFVNFVIDRDNKDEFVFGALQGKKGVSLLKKHNLPHDKISTIVLLKNGKIYRKSSAALEVIKGLSGAWPMLYIFKIIPYFIRDFVYDIIAKSRYTVFGKSNACRMPTPELKNKFIDEVVQKHS